MLAIKLGVATEGLWIGLHRQAMISGIVSLIQYALIIFGCYWYSRYVRLVHKQVSKRDWDEIAWLPCGAVGIVCFILVCAIVFTLDSTAAAFLNPDYWAIS